MLLRFIPVSLLLAAIAAVSGPASAASDEASPAGVARLYSAPWIAGDEVRDGAGEFSVFLQAAQLQRAHRAAGLVVIGDRNGMLRSGGERALRLVVYTGVAVVKLAPGGAVAPGPEVFLTAGTLAPERAESVLRECLARHGSPPAAAEPERPTAAEVAAIRAHLKPFATALLQAASVTVAAHQESSR